MFFLFLVSYLWFLTDGLFILLYVVVQVVVLFFVAKFCVAVVECFLVIIWNMNFVNSVCFYFWIVFYMSVCSYLNNLIHIQKLMLMERNITGNTIQHDARTQHVPNAARCRPLPFMRTLIKNYWRNNITALQQQKWVRQPECAGSFCCILGYDTVCAINWLPAFRKTYCHNFQGRISHVEETIGIMGEVGQMSHGGKEWPTFSV
jgi:hypothetical protein